MSTLPNNNKPVILGTAIDLTSYDNACQTILDWQADRQSRMICFANVHMIMTAYDSPAFQSMLNEADLVTSDGMPLVWTLQLMGYKDQTRVYGPTLTVQLLKQVEAAEIPIGFLGSTPEVLDKLKTKILHKHPKIKIVYAYSPPFGDLNTIEDQSIIDQINNSGTRILFIGLGCPKQEIWMHNTRGKVQAVMLGVGAAFDFIAEQKSQAPQWMQRIGMEWFYRLITEPKRLWKRYLYHNPRFIFAVTHDLLRNR